MDLTTYGFTKNGVTDRLMPSSCTLRRASQMPIKREGRFIKCCACHRDITTSAAVVAYGDMMHPSCFKCEVCEQWIRGGEEYTKLKGQIVCMNCLLSKPKELCKGCKLPVDERVIEASGAHWHYVCFSCNVCSRPLADLGFFLIDDIAFCAEHYWQIQKQPPTEK